MKFLSVLFLIFSFNVCAVIGQGGNGGDEIRSTFIDVGEVIIQELGSLKFTALMDKFNIEISSLAATLSTDVIQVVEQVEKDNTKSIVDAIGVKGNISLEEKKWERIIKNEKSLKKMVLHEMFRGAGIDDDDYRISKEFYPFKIKDVIDSRPFEITDGFVRTEYGRGGSYNQYPTHTLHRGMTITINPDAIVGKVTRIRLVDTRFGFHLINDSEISFIPHGENVWIMDQSSEGMGHPTYSGNVGQDALLKIFVQTDQNVLYIMENADGTPLNFQGGNPTAIISKTTYENLSIDPGMTNDQIDMIISLVARYDVARAFQLLRQSLFFPQTNTAQLLKIMNYISDGWSEYKTIVNTQVDDFVLEFLSAVSMKTLDELPDQAITYTRYDYPRSKTSYLLAEQFQALILAHTKNRMESLKRLRNDPSIFPEFFLAEKSSAEIRNDKVSRRKAVIAQLKTINVFSATVLRVIVDDKIEGIEKELLDYFSRSTFHQAEAGYAFDGSRYYWYQMLVDVRNYLPQMKSFINNVELLEKIIDEKIFSEFSQNIIHVGKSQYVTWHSFINLEMVERYINEMKPSHPRMDEMLKMIK